MAFPLRRVFPGLTIFCAVAAPTARAQTTPESPAELGQVTVTAQSRPQLSQVVPITLDNLSSDTLDSVQATDISRLNLFVPGLQVNANEPTQAVFRLRGIETSDFGIGTDSAVGIFIDGVQQSRSGGALMALNDVARIEVLKGPQGALFGRNTAAGAISIISNEPGDTREARARIRMGNDGRRYADALLNLPLNPDMALRLSAVGNFSNGWIGDANSGRRYGKDDEWGTRASWRWNATPATRVVLAWTHDQLRQPGRTDIGLIPLSTDPQQRPPFPADPASYLDPRHAPLYSDAVNGHARRNYDAATLTVNHDFGWASLQSISNATGYALSHTEDADGTNHVVSHLDTGVDGYGHSLYQELRLTGGNDRLDWVAGASYASEHARQTNLIQSNTDTVDTMLHNRGIQTGTPDGSLYGYFDSLLRLFQLPYHLLGQSLRESIDNRARSTAWSAFGDATWHLSPRLNLTTGLRVTRDHKDFRWYTAPRVAEGLDRTLDQLEQAGLLAFAAQQAHTTPQLLRAALSRNLIYADAVGRPVSRHNQWDDVSPRLVLDYRFSSDTMAFASLAKGYKAGGYNGVQVNSGFAPEQAWNLEAGIKTVFPAQRLLLNSSIYSYRYDHRQALSLIPDDVGVGVPQYRITNTDQQATGLDVQAQWRPFGEWRVGFDLSYIDATYRRALTASGLDLSGQATGEPRISRATHLGYRWRDVAGGTLDVDLRHGYRGRTRCNQDTVYQGSCAAGTSFGLGSAQQRTDLRLGWEARHGDWGVALYANNLFNQRYVESVVNVSTAVLGTPYAIVTRPRSWGIELSAGF